jgi:hypothetical protein
LSPGAILGVIGSLVGGMAMGLCALMVSTSQPAAGGPPSQFAAQPSLGAPVQAATSPSPKPPSQAQGQAQKPAAAAPAAGGSTTVQGAGSGSGDDGGD